MSTLPQAIWHEIVRYMRPEDWYMAVYSSREFAGCLAPFRANAMRNDAPDVGDLVILDAQNVGRIFRRRGALFVIRHINGSKTCTRVVRHVRRVRVFPDEVSVDTQIWPYVWHHETDIISYSTVIQCPTCHYTHKHGMGTGSRGAHCYFYGDSKAFVGRYSLSYSEEHARRVCEAWRQSRPHLRNCPLDL